MSKNEPAPVEASIESRLGDQRTVDDRVSEPIDPAHRAAVAAGLADMRAGRVASPEEIDEAYARFGRPKR